MSRDRTHAMEAAVGWKTGTGHIFTQVGFLAVFGSPEKRGVFGMLELLGCPAGSDRNKLVSWFILPILGTYPTYLYRGYNPFTK